MTRPTAAHAWPVPALSRRTDLSSLSERFAATGRVQLTQLLTEGYAQHLHQALAGPHVAWQLIFNKADQLYELSPAVQREIGPDRCAELVRAVQAEGRERFQYLFENLRVPDVRPTPRDQVALPELAELADFLNGEPFLALMRQVTGRSDICFADCQATRYRAGHFLNPHDDNVAGKHRVAAFVLSLTPRWRAAWGGQLQFLDADDRVSEVLVPGFNVLNIFRVPQLHQVSAVAPLVDPACARLSVTGWLRTAVPA